MPGHDFGHEAGAPPAGLDWGRYVEHFAAEHGGWSALADELIRRGTGVLEVSADLQIVEKGLRRLARRGHRGGGKYGRWMLRLFGVPVGVETWVRWLGQYHRRFADLPTSLRLEQLRLWDRPPVIDSRASAWVHVGMASVLQRQRDVEGAGRRLALARNGATRAGPSAEIEVALLGAFMATNEDRRAEAEALLAAVEGLLDERAAAIDADDRLCYRARLLCQRAFHLTRPVAGELPDLVAAQRLFAAIEGDDELPFVGYRKHAGLAWCAWQRGEIEEGMRLARLAAEYAGDGGLVRFRVMAFKMLSRMLPAADGAAMRARAARLARWLEDEDLLRRVG